MASGAHQRKTRRARLRRMVPWLASLWLVGVLAFFVGALTQRAKIWPYSVFEELGAFARGDREERSTLVEKVSNDLGIRPERLLVEKRGAFEPRAELEPLQGLPLKERRQPVHVFLSETATPGYRLIHGSFDFEDSLHGAVLLDPSGRVQRTWSLRQDDVEWLHAPEETTFAHGVDILEDGSIVVAFDRGSQLARYTYCGKKMWTVHGGYHHSVTLDDQGFLWTFVDRGPELADMFIARIDAATGESVSTISLTELVEKNSDIDIFGVGQLDDAAASSYRQDPWHPNDVDPLSARHADAYPQFEAGDLLVSYRNLDLVFVVSPSSLRVKWWRQGLTRRQHDPDWNGRGTIGIFDNNMHRAVSRILEVDPRDMGSRVVVRGSDYDFYSRIRGKHQELPDGSRLITSSQQGRAFEIAPSGEVVFELINPYDQSHWLPLAEAKFLPSDYFGRLERCED